MTRNFLRRVWPLAVVAALLALASLAAGHSALQFRQIEPTVKDAPGLPDYQAPPSPVVPTATPSTVASSDGARIPGWILTAAMVLGVVLVTALFGLLLRMLIRDLLRRRSTRPRRAGTKGPRQMPERTAAEVVAAVDAGLVDLSDSDADPRRAVIACWVRLEQAASAAGVPRQIGDTPTDLVTRLLRGDQTGPGGTGGPVIVSVDVLAAFAHVYREARYATHTVDERMRAQARSALTRLRAELTPDAPRQPAAAEMS